jgi:anti-anti-sigma factor
MRLSTTQTGEVLVLTINEPRLDRKNGHRLREAVAAHLRPGVKIALDFGQVRHVDGLGYGAVLSLQQDTAACGGEVAVCALRGPVRDVFQKLCLHRRVRTFNRPDEATRVLQDVG